ncbi:hypothetical protein MAUB_01190 [Mycolicibacterium aubagnense]|uniref:Uncharacterized protein n=1 Tax=Mycolicibacterium aubagnense TaxID=319707 RepID=A0ABM7I6S6_9MYCO|nr:hypothetical protein MAUB_01190 [Mycolicibacterium aubagnense]
MTLAGLVTLSGEIQYANHPRFRHRLPVTVWSVAPEKCVRNIQFDLACLFLPAATDKQRVTDPGLATECHAGEGVSPGGAAFRRGYSSACAGRGVAGSS